MCSVIHRYWLFSFIVEKQIQLSSRPADSSIVCSSVSVVSGLIGWALFLFKDNMLFVHSDSSVTKLYKSGFCRSLTCASSSPIIAFNNFCVIFIVNYVTNVISTRICCSFMHNKNASRKHGRHFMVTQQPNTFWNVDLYWVQAIVQSKILPSFDCEYVWYDIDFFLDSNPKYSVPKRIVRKCRM